MSVKKTLTCDRCAAVGPTVSQRAWRSEGPPGWGEVYMEVASKTEGSKDLEVDQAWDLCPSCAALIVGVIAAAMRRET